MSKFIKYVASENRRLKQKIDGKPSADRHTHPAGMTGEALGRAVSMSPCWTKRNQAERLLRGETPISYPHNTHFISWNIKQRLLFWESARTIHPEAGFNNSVSTQLINSPSGLKVTTVGDGDVFCSPFPVSQGAGQPVLGQGVLEDTVRQTCLGLKWGPPPEPLLRELKQHVTIY